MVYEYQRILKHFPFQAKNDPYMESFQEHRAFAEQHGVIAGGFAVWLGTADTNWTPGDIDVFAYTAEGFTSLIRYFGKIATPTGIGENLQSKTYTFGDLSKGVKWNIISAPDKEYIQKVKPFAWHSPEWSADLFYQNREIAGLWTAGLFDLRPVMCFIHQDQVAGVGGALPYDRFWGYQLDLSNVNNPFKTLKRIMKWHARGYRLQDVHLGWLLREIRYLPEDKYTELGYAAGVVPASEMPWFDEYMAEEEDRRRERELED